MSFLVLDCSWSLRSSDSCSCSVADAVATGDAPEDCDVDLAPPVRFEEDEGGNSDDDSDGDLDGDDGEDDNSDKGRNLLIGGK